MNEFTYVDGEHNLNVNSCRWLKKVGLKETRWILDVAWLLSSCDDLTYREWIEE